MRWGEVRRSLIKEYLKAAILEPTLTRMTMVADTALRESFALMTTCFFTDFNKRYYTSDRR